MVATSRKLLEKHQGRNTMRVMAKRKKESPPRDEHIETEPFTCRVPESLIAAFSALSLVTRTRKPGTELARAAEQHILEMYRLLKSDSDSRFIDAVHVPAFLTAAEAFFRDSGLSVPDAK